MTLINTAAMKRVLLLPSNLKIIETLSIILKRMSSFEIK
jgi:hypothetical protein